MNNIAENFAVQGGGVTDDVPSLNKVAGALRASFNSGGHSELFGPLRDFKKDNRPYLYSMMVLKMISGGMDFDSRFRPRTEREREAGSFYEDVVNHFSGNLPTIAQDMNIFAVNTGNPAGGQLKSLVDLPLTDIARGYFNKDWIGNMILTNSPVMYQTGLIGLHGNEQNNPPTATDVIAEGTGNVHQLKRPSTAFDTYNVRTYAIMDSVTQNDRRNYMLPFDAERDLVTMLKTLLMLICEIDIQAKLTNTTNTYNPASVIALGMATGLMTLSQAM